MQDVMTFLSHHLTLSIIILVLIVLLAIVESLRARRQGFQLSPAQITRLINQENAAIIDIRPNEAFRKGHIIGAESWLSKELQDNSKKLEKFKTRPIVIVCGTGMESQKIAAFLLKHDYNAYTLNGGVRAWSEANMPLVKE